MQVNYLAKKRMTTFPPKLPDSLPRRHINSPSQRVSATSNGSGAIRRSAADLDYDPASGRWTLAKGISIDVERLREKVAGQLEPGLTNTLVHYAERKTGRSVNNICLLLYQYFSFAKEQGKVQEIREQDILNFRAEMCAQDAHDGRLIKLRPFFCTWSSLGYPGVSKEISRFFRSLKLVAPPRGQAVLSLDPKEGPLEQSESAALRAGVMAAYGRGLITHEGLVVSLFLSYTGRRPIQLAHLKLMDLDDSRTDDLHPMELNQTRRKMLLVHVPRAKQTDSKFRQFRRSIEVIPALWAALIRLREEVICRFDEMLVELDWKLDLADRERIHLQLPLFPSWAAIKDSVAKNYQLVDQRPFGQKLVELQEKAASAAWHRSSAMIRKLLVEAVTTASVSSRTGEPLKAVPRRLRYAKGTDAARAGYGKLIIAELLDHTTTHTVDVYTKTVPEHAAPINKAMALAMSPLVQLFRGQMVDREIDAVGGDKPLATRILIKGEGAATCGAGVQCGLNRLPRPCYTCDSFQPWLDGPHEALLEDLLRERQQRLEILGNPAMVGVEDNTIIAVVNVIQRCEARRAELNDRAGKIGRVGKARKKRETNHGVKYA